MSGIEGHDGEDPTELSATGTSGAFPAGETSLAKVAAEWRLVGKAQRSFAQAVSAARAQGFSWEHIAEHVPGFARRYGPVAAEKLFEAVAVAGSQSSGPYVSWRCGDCDSLVLDRGPYGGHPVDSEQGHREDCGHLRGEVTAYLASLEDREPPDPPDSGIAVVPGDQAPLLARRQLPIAWLEPGLEL